MIRWDWYRATVRGVGVDEMINYFISLNDLSSARPATPKNGYLRAVEVVRGDSVLASFWWGGNAGVLVTGTGDRSPGVADFLLRGRMMGWDVSPSRVDACCDWIEPGLFDSLSHQMIDYATNRGLSINQQGDWARGIARTLYLGAPSSHVRLVLYEKGYESGGDKSWVRLEVRVKPALHAKHFVAQWEPYQAFGASKWLVDLMQQIGFDAIEKSSVGTVWKPSDTERQRAALLRQYGKIMRHWANDVGGWDNLGLAIESALIDIEQQSGGGGVCVVG